MSNVSGAERCVICGRDIPEGSQVCVICGEIPKKKDMVEVKHGEWLQTKEPLGWHDVDCVECSICHESWICDEDFDFEFCKEMWHYCPNCGAKMDKYGERKEK